MLDRAFDRVYTKFKLHFYRAVFARFQNREASLTTVESFCMEIINALGHPTINEFSSFVNISPPNAAYKVNSLVKKGYVVRARGKEDRRIVYISLSDKGRRAYEHHAEFHRQMIDSIKEELTPQELDILYQALTKLNRWFRELNQ